MSFSEPRWSVSSCLVAAAIRGSTDPMTSRIWRYALLAMAVTSLTGFSLVLAGAHSLSVVSGARTLPIVFAPLYEPPVRRPLLVLGADPPVGGGRLRRPGRRDRDVHGVVRGRRGQDAGYT